MYIELVRSTCTCMFGDLSYDKKGIFVSLYTHACQGIAYIDKIVC